VKYIAKSAAKNINSLESQTIVPTATAFGREILWCDTALVIKVIIPENMLAVCLGSVWNPSFLLLKR
jgi:hypothetical protein